MVADILGDAAARTMMFGSTAYAYGFSIPGVWTGTKTGTTTTTNSAVTKDSWIASFSTSVATTVWNGNHDGSGLANSSNNLVRRVVNDYMERVHKEVYGPDGRWHSGDKPVAPAGIQTMTVNGQKDIWPSWYNSKTSGATKETLVFNRVTKKLARDCTPESLRESIEVTVMEDAVSKSKVYSGLPEGYDRESEDTCTYQSPTVAISNYSGGQVHFGVVKGTAALNRYIIYVTDSAGTEQEVTSGEVKEDSNSVAVTLPSGAKKIRVQVTDVNGESASAEKTL